MLLFFLFLNNKFVLDTSGLCDSWNMSFVGLQAWNKKRLEIGKLPATSGKSPLPVHTSASQLSAWKECVIHINILL